MFQHTKINYFLYFKKNRANPTRQTVSSQAEKSKTTLSNEDAYQKIEFLNKELEALEGQECPQGNRLKFIIGSIKESLANPMPIVPPKKTATELGMEHVLVRTQ